MLTTSGRVIAYLVAFIGIGGLVVLAITLSDRAGTSSDATGYESEGGSEGRKAGSRSRDAAAPWDQLFRHGAPPKLHEEVSFVAQCASRISQERLLPPGGKVLVLAMGDGRHAVRFAREGYEVTGLDISSVAIEAAEKAASENDVTIRAIEGDVFEYDFGREKWDMVTNIYFNPAIRIFDRIKGAIRPGGLLLVEGYGADYKGPGAPPWSRYKRNQLLDALAGWRILVYEDGRFPSDWAGGREVPVVRVLARKPE